MDKLNECDLCRVARFIARHYPLIHFFYCFWPAFDDRVICCRASVHRRTSQFVCLLFFTLNSFMCALWNSNLSSERKTFWLSETIQPNSFPKWWSIKFKFLRKKVSCLFWKFFSISAEKWINKQGSATGHGLWLVWKTVQWTSKKSAATRLMRSWSTAESTRKPNLFTASFD